MSEAVTLFRELLDDVDRRDARGVRSLVVLQDNGDGTVTVRDGNPETLDTWSIPLAYGLVVVPDDIVLTVRVGGRETAIMILRRES